MDVTTRKKLQSYQKEEYKNGKSFIKQSSRT